MGPANNGGDPANDGILDELELTGGDWEDVATDLDAALTFRYARAFPGWGPDTILDTPADLLAAIGRRVELERAELEAQEAREAMGQADNPDESPGNPARRQMLSMLAGVTAREQRRR